MSDSEWLRQSRDKPLFDDLLWSRPENKSRAGKLLIAGGNSHGFNAPAQAYNQATATGVGSLKVLLPDKLKSTVGRHIEEAVYCPSTTSGSFGRQALAEFLDYASWADMTLLAGDFGHNSETAILLESFTHDYQSLLCLAGDSLNSFLINPSNIFNRPDTLIVADLGILQKLLPKLHYRKAITASQDLLQLVEILKDLTKIYPLSIITIHQEHIMVAVNSKISTTKFEGQLNDLPSNLATQSSVWWLQNKSKQFEALTTAVYSSLDAE